jgi:hypothetical protein
MKDTNAQWETEVVLHRLHDAMNRHDLPAFVACFDNAYASAQPVHPDREFVGREQVETNWGRMFAGVPDFHATLLRSAISGEEAWAEWQWTGTRADHSKLDVRGVTIFGVRSSRIAWGHLYVEDVDHRGKGIDEAVSQLATGPGS